MANSPEPAAGACFRHAGFFYQTTAEYTETVAGFLREGLATGEAAFVALPAACLGLIRDALGQDAHQVEFADMTQVGGNPARIIPRLLEFLAANAGKRGRYVGEPIWAARSPAETREATKHESLVNLAFEHADVEILCPYNAAELTPAVLTDARRTHPLVMSADGYMTSPDYNEAHHLPTSCSMPLPAPTNSAMYHTYRTNLSQVRALVLQHARQAGLTEGRANDLVLAVSEVAANTLRYTQAPGTLSLWRDQDEVICEVHDEGTITDPLVGRRKPAPDAMGGHGLWLVHQVCDLVELRSDTSGTTIRMHMKLHPPVP